MNAPRLKSISGVAFGSFVDRFEQDLPATGLLLLDGENTETGGSSGSGKSTFIHALNYPFGTCKVPLTALQSWLTDDTPSVSATYEIDGHEVVVTRGKRFQLEIDGTPFPGSAKQKEEKLDQLFGLDAELRAALTYRGQRRPGLFLSKTDAEKKELLTKVLKLTEFEQAADDGEVSIKKLEDAVAVHVAHLDDLKVRLDQLGAVDVTSAQKEVDETKRAVALHEEDCKMLEDSIAQLHVEADAAAAGVFVMYQPQVNEVQKRLKVLQETVVPQSPPTEAARQAQKLVDDCTRRCDRLLAEDRQRALDVQRSRASINKAIHDLSRRLGAAGGVMAQKDTALAELEALKALKCPTCEREWQEAETKRQAYEDKLAALDARLTELVVVQEEVDRLSVELGQLVHEPDPKVAQMGAILDQLKRQLVVEEEKVHSARTIEMAALQKALAETKMELTSLQVRVSEQADGTRSKMLAGIDGLEALVHADRTTLATLNEELRQWQYELGTQIERQKQVDRICDDEDDTTATLRPLQQQLARERDFADAIGRTGFLGSYFDEVLREISDKANGILASIANTAHCTIRFDTESVTQKGTVRREIVPVVTIGGHKATLNFGPSGGMLSAIELAVDLAVGAVIAGRAGTCPGWIILDESFDGLGPVEKKTCMEILQTYAHDRLVIVVDHMSETKGWFTQRVKIEFSGGKSRIC